ncbi:putative T7SS-secreted protein [Streptomyces goshikiensis]|uniref:putative T7SS-secreted protein n=1 Tax=Streptomyces goshikiensis TaxID=1942 RepID=UPI0037A34A1A
MTDWGDLANRGLDKVEHGLDRAKKVVGSGVDRATDRVGGVLEGLGAHDWADKVEDFGDTGPTRSRTSATGSPPVSGPKSASSGSARATRRTSSCTARPPRSGSRRSTSRTSTRPSTAWARA